MCIEYRRTKDMEEYLWDRHVDALQAWRENPLNEAISAAQLLAEYEYCAYSHTYNQIPAHWSRYDTGHYNVQR